MRMSERFSGMAWAVIWLVAVHVAVVIPHSAAHLALGVVPSAIDIAFIVVVIVIAPIVALPFVLRGSRVGAGLLTGTLAASWLYGMVNHFIIEGADHVIGLDQGAWQATFTISGVLLLVLEALGTLLAAWVFWRVSRSGLRNTTASEAPLSMPR